jgi:hypothetical protein
MSLTPALSVDSLTRYIMNISLSPSPRLLVTKDYLCLLSPTRNNKDTTTYTRGTSKCPDLIP